MGMSFAQQMAAMEPEEVQAVMDLATDEQLLEMARGEWWYVARPEQIAPPGDWQLWLLLAGRGFGKSRCVYEWLIERILANPLDVAGIPTEHLVVAPSIADCIGISIEGPSGLLNILRRKGIEFHYIKSPRPLILVGPADGPRPKIHFVGADKGDVGRGSNLATIVMDELVKFPDPDSLWRQGLLPALRAALPNDHPRAACATTPKPLKILKDWVKEADDPEAEGITVVTRGATYDNAANLDQLTLRRLKKQYEGTTVGRQELEGALLDDMDGPLFSYSWIDAKRIGSDVIPVLEHIAVGVDPCLTGEEDSDLMGVVVVGRDANEHMYVLADESVPLTSGEAARHAWMVFNRWDADTLVIENNLAKAWLRKVMVDTYDEMKKEGIFPEFSKARLKEEHAQQGKKTRAEPVALRYEQGRVHHVGVFEKLESEMVSWDPISSKVSPDRMDALVWACSHLMSGEKHKVRIFNPLNRKIAGLG
jgi:Uncharacterized conserved protein